MRLRGVWWVIFAAMSLLVFLGLAGCGGDSSGKVSDVDVTFAVAMTPSNTFDPAVLNVTPGSTVVWTNLSTSDNTIVTDPGNLASHGPHSGVIPPGKRAIFVVPDNAAPGTVWFYHSEQHGTAGNGTSLGTGMAGEIIVVAGP